MSRVVLIHWNAAEGEERATTLQPTGHEITVHAPREISDFRAIRDDPPDVLAIDLTRLPSQGREAAIWFRRQKATRLVPIVFVGGDTAKVAGVRRGLPDAEYTEWRRIRSALRHAISHAPQAPIVPNPMDRYSGRPLSKKLGIRPNTVMMLLGAPRGFTRTLGQLPATVRIRSRAQGQAHLIMLFVGSRAELSRRLPPAQRAMAEGGSLWIAWPKQASGVATDLTQQIVRTTGLDAGLVDYKICAIDETWSGLRFARRRAAKH